MLEAWLRMELQVCDLPLVKLISVSSMGSAGVYFTKEVTTSVTMLLYKDSIHNVYRFWGH